MQIIRGLHNLRAEHRGCVATVGNFDGVHLGHQAVFARLHHKAEELGLPATVVTFEPQPLEFFAPDRAPSRLTRLREKLEALHSAGIERVVILEFGPRMAHMSAAVFVRRLLIDGLDVRFLMVGDDFRFGQGREGDINLLRDVGQQHGFEVTSLDTFALDGERVSSTAVRKALTDGDLALASRYLGRPYIICGRVAHGHARGRTIGFPTANVELRRKISPLRGVYAVTVSGLGGVPLPGVANIGNRPTIEGDPHYLLEVHLFDFDQQIYGAHLEVEFCLRLRDEQKFDSFDALRAQIDRDAQAARDFFRVREAS